jgi:hypothetical protein
MGRCKVTHKVILGAAAFLCVMFVLPRTAEAQGKIELFGGFSYLRGNIIYQQQGSGGVCVIVCFPGSPTVNLQQNPNLFGWEASGAYHFVPFLSVVADFGEEYGSLNGGNVRLRTYLFGPQLSLPGPVSPFVHGEFGFAHESVGTFTNPNLVSPGSDTSSATVLGGGLDIKAVPFLSLRVIQIDDLLTRLYNSKQNEPRVSAGIVVHF